MPILDISDLAAPWSHPYVIAVMLQPAVSTQAHRKIVSGLRAKGALEWRRGSDAASDEAVRMVWDAIIAEPFDLAREIPEAYSKQSHYSKGRMAGLILGLILRETNPCARGASLETAYQEIYRQFNNKVKGVSRNTLREVWLEYRAVSHLWLARDLYPSAGLLRGADLAGFLAVSEAIRLAGERHHSQTDGGQLLPPASMWAAPSTLTLPECSISDGKITLQDHPY
jgi:hypothetical protein